MGQNGNNPHNPSKQENKGSSRVDARITQRRGGRKRKQAARSFKTKIVPSVIFSYHSASSIHLGTSKDPQHRQAQLLETWLTQPTAACIRKGTLQTPQTQTSSQSHQIWHFYCDLDPHVPGIENSQPRLPFRETSNGPLRMGGGGGGGLYWIWGSHNLFRDHLVV